MTGHAIQFSAIDIDTLARTLYGEAEAGDVDDAIAIAWVVVNRCTLPNWPDRPAAVCKQPWQFSCWNADNPRLGQMMSASRGGTDRWFNECWRVAEGVAAGEYPDPTDRATHYHTTYIATPKWARGKAPTYQTPGGRYNHLFYNNIDTPPPQSARQALDQQRPLGDSRTMRGGAIAGAATVASLSGSASEVSDIAAQVSQIGWSVQSALSLGLPVLGLIALCAVGWMLYARWQDRKRGLR